MERSHIFALILVSCCLQTRLVYSETANLVEAWDKIAKDYSNDIQQSDDIYHQIRSEQLTLSQLQVIVERHLVSKNAEVLINALGSDEVTAIDGKVKQIIENFNNKYETKIIERILAETLNEIVVLRKLPEIPDLLWSIYKKDDRDSFIDMLRLQIQLFKSLSEKHPIDDKEFLNNFAYRLYKILQDPLYKTTGLSFQSSVQNIEQKMPNRLKYLYFMPHFCLLNAKYEKYMYMAIEAKIDRKSRYIWLWSNTKTMDDTGFLKAYKIERDGEKKHKLILKSTKYDMHYYLMPASMKLAGWDSKETPINYIWDLEFLNNSHVILSQNDSLICASDPHDSERRNIRGRFRSAVPDNPECEWQLGECRF